MSTISDPLSPVTGATIDGLSGPEIISAVQGATAQQATQSLETHVRPEDSAASLPGRIVVGVDGSDASVNAFRRGIRIATALGADLEAISTPPWSSARTLEGHADQVLIDENRGAEMLILGSRSHGGIAGVLLGSVSGACAEQASCPVLILH